MLLSTPLRASASRQRHKRKTIYMTKAKSIPMPDEAVKAIKDAEVQFATINQGLNNFLTGLRIGLNVPKNYTADVDKRAFVPKNGKKDK